MLIQGYSDFSLTKQGPPLANGAFARFRLPTDVSPLFPYINSLDNAAGFFPELPFIRFVLDGFCVGLHGEHGVGAAFADRRQALKFMARLLDFLNEVSRRREQLEPNYRAWSPAPALEIFQLLPRTNCRGCGYPSCLAFAAAVSRRQTGPEGCPGFQRPLRTQAVYPLRDKQGELVATVTLDLDLKTGNGGAWSAGSGKAVQTAPPLSRREQEVLRQVARGATNLEIAASLGVSPHTVKSHIISIFNNLAVNDRTQAAVWAVRHKLA